MAEIDVKMMELGVPVPGMVPDRKMMEIVIEDYKKTYNDIASTLLLDCLNTSKGKNIVLSPYSIIALLAITADAVKGDARSEILSSVFQDLSYGDMVVLYKSLAEVLSEKKALNTANAVCVNDSIKDTIKPAYAKTLKDTFRGELFCSKRIVDDVNAWVKKNTKGMIDKIADASMSDMLAALLNAVAFDAKWKNKYQPEDIEDDYFTNADKSVSDVKMLWSDEFSYIENDYFEGFTKDYEDCEYCYMGLLPKKKGMKSLKEAVSRSNLTELYESRKNEEVHVYIPEYKNEYCTSLVDYLKSMGVRTAFTNKADFSPISDAKLALDDMIHKAYIEVDRNGTKAAAVTMGMVVAGCCIWEVKNIKLNRPFVYAIIHKPTGLPVFVGIVEKL